MEPRKQKEAEFHDKIRDKRLEEDIGLHERLTSNRKFYSIVRKSTEFVINYLTQNCSGKRVLDYCCGDGDTAVLMAEYGAEVIGIDISPVSIQNAKEKALKKRIKNIHFFVMDAERLEFGDESLDLIACLGVLHHLDLKKVYPELARVLKPDGKIICNEPLVHNPLFQLYRRLTPHLRTKWETEHILSKREIKLAERYFGKIEKRFFHLSTLLAVSFRNTSVFGFILNICETIDSILLKLPFIKWWAWQIVFILSDPKKQNGGT